MVYIGYTRVTRGGEGSSHLLPVQKIQDLVMQGNKQAKKLT